MRCKRIDKRKGIEMRSDMMGVCTESESEGNYNQGGAAGVKPEAGSVLDKTQEVGRAESFPRGKQGACPVTE